MAKQEDDVGRYVQQTRWVTCRSGRVWCRSCVVIQLALPTGPKFKAKLGESLRKVYAKFTPSFAPKINKTKGLSPKFNSLLQAVLQECRRGPMAGMHIRAFKKSCAAVGVRSPRAQVPGRLGNTRSHVYYLQVPRQSRKSHIVEVLSDSRGNLRAEFASKMQKPHQLEAGRLKTKVAPPPGSDSTRILP